MDSALTRLDPPYDVSPTICCVTSGVGGAKFGALGSITQLTGPA